MSTQSVPATTNLSPFCDRAPTVALSGGPPLAYLSRACPDQACELCQQPGVFAVAWHPGGRHLPIPFPAFPGPRPALARVVSERPLDFQVVCRDLPLARPFTLRCHSTGHLEAMRASPTSPSDGILDTRSLVLASVLTGLRDIGTLAAHDVRTSFAATSVLVFAIEQHASAWTATGWAHDLLRRIRS